jgi:hypothetical protein
MDEELGTKIENLIQAVQMIASKTDELAERVDELDSVLFDGLIGPANEKIAQDEYDAALSDFRCKFGEKLDKFDALAKAEEGDDFDLVKKAFDDYNENDYPFSPSEYIDKRVEQFEEKAKALAEAAGTVVNIKTETPEGEEVEVTATPEGDVKTEVEGKAIEGKEVKSEEIKSEPEVEAKEESTEEPKEEEKKEESEELDTVSDERAKWRKAAKSAAYKNLRI